MKAKKKFEFPKTIYVIRDPYDDSEDGDSLLAYATWPERELSETKPIPIAVYSLDSQGNYVVEIKIVKKGG